MSNPLDTLVYDRLIAGTNQKVVTNPGTIKSGTAAFKRGTLLGQITTGGKLQICKSGAVDGSQNPYAVASEDVDASAADVVTEVMLSGEFNEDALIFDGADTKETFRAAMRDLNMYMHTTVPTTGGT